MNYKPFCFKKPDINKVIVISFYFDLILCEYMTSYCRILHNLTTQIRALQRYFPVYLKISKIIGRKSYAD